MTLIHVAFPEGAPIHIERGAADLGPQIGQIAANKSIVRVDTPLPVGITRITPAHWRKHTHEYFAEALPNGDGVMHMLPRDEGVAYQTSENPEELLRGGQYTRLPQDGIYLPIIGPKPGTMQFMLYTLLVHMPGQPAEQ